MYYDNAMLCGLMSASCPRCTISMLADWQTENTMVVVAIAEQHIAALLERVLEHAGRKVTPGERFV
jgi:hypothetical protein